MATQSPNIWTRSRGDMAADNRRLYDVANCAARILQRYTWTDDVQRQFLAEPAVLPSPFGLLDVLNEWRALFEALIVAGIIEPDHLGVPLDTSDAVFLRIQEYAGGGDYWRTVSMFEVIPGARSYAMADAAAIEAYYQDTGRAIRVLREVAPAAARVEYMNGDRTRVNHVAVIGMIQAGAMVELSTGYAAISEWIENPDDVVGAAFWPARIVLQGVPGPRGPAGPAGGGGSFGDTFGATVGGVGGLWASVAQYVPGVGFVLSFYGADGEGGPFESVSEALNAAVLWLQGHAADGRVAVSRFDPDVGSWELSAFEGGAYLDPDTGAVTSYGEPVLSASGLHFVSQGLAAGAGDAWLSSVGMGGGLLGRVFEVLQPVAGVGLALRLSIGGEVVPGPMQHFSHMAAAMAAGREWLAMEGADAGRWEVEYRADAEGPDKYMRTAYGLGVEASDWSGEYFEAPAAADVAADMVPFLGQYVNAGFGPVPEWVSALTVGPAGFQLVEFGNLVWPAAPGYAGGDLVAIYDQTNEWVNIPGRTSYGAKFESRLVVHDALAGAAGAAAVAAVAFVQSGSEPGSWGIVSDDGVLVGTVSLAPGGAIARAWVPEPDSRPWVKIDSRAPGGTVGGGALWWVSCWADRSEWGRAAALCAGLYGGATLDVLTGITVDGVPQVPRVALLVTDGETVYPELPAVGTGNAWANVTGAVWGAGQHPEWSNGEAWTDPVQAAAAAALVGDSHFPGGYAVRRIYTAWADEIPA